MSLNFGKESGSLSGSNPHIGLPAILDCEKHALTGGVVRRSGVGTTARGWAQQLNSLKQNPRLEGHSRTSLTLTYRVILKNNHYFSSFLDISF